MLDTSDIEGTIQNWPRLVASPLGIGWIELDDGSRVQGFRQVGKERLASCLVDVRGANSLSVSFLTHHIRRPF